MSTAQASCPLSRQQIVDRYFMEHRAKLIDIAAFLDRLERASDSATDEDFRVADLRKAVQILVDGQSNRAKRVLELFSDPTTEPIESAAGMKGALGAYQASTSGELA